jgi:hypothetical protein
MQVHAARMPVTAALLTLPALQADDGLSWHPASPAALPGAAQLQQLAALAQGRWAQQPGLDPEGSAPATTLRWQRSGKPLGELRLGLEPGVLWWCAAGQACLRAEVPPDALRALVGRPPGER